MVQNRAHFAALHSRHDLATSRQVLRPEDFAIPTAGDFVTDNSSDRCEVSAAHEARQLTDEEVLRDYESDWGGSLPGTPHQVAQYLQERARMMSIAALTSRLAAISHWHQAQRFPDPTQSTYVLSALKSITNIPAEAPRRARTLRFEHLEMIDAWLEHQVAQASTAGKLPYLRNRALLLIGFWRGFRSDELTRLIIDNVTLERGRGMTLCLPHTLSNAADDNSLTYRTAALARLCPVAAYEAWIDASQLTSGPVFRSIDRWGTISESALATGSITPLLRGIFRSAGVPDAGAYSSHSLRQGFATWARSNAWDVKMLTEYVGWKNPQSAKRYLDAQDPVPTFRT